jgi:DNA-binding NarL/FixJ family response regulator
VTPVRVLLVDDQSLFREALATLLSVRDEVEVVGEAANGAEAVECAARLRPDVVLMDLRMPEVDGLTATKRISANPALGGVKVVVLTTFDDDEHVFGALRAGASGFLVKDVEPEELLQAVRVVARGDALLSPSVTRSLIAAFTATAADPSPRRTEAALPAHGARPRAEPGAPPGLATLTDREREVVALVAEGLSNEEIAARLVVSPLTAKTHVSRAMTKLAARDRAQLVVLAYTFGLASPSA